MDTTDPRFVPLLLLTVSFVALTFYFERQGIKKQGGSKAKNYRAAGGESIVAGIRFAWQTPYHIGTVLQIVLLLLIIAFNLF